MNLSDPRSFLPTKRRRAFTLPEVLVSVVIVSVMFTSLYAGISQGYAIITATRENLRATQIMIEKVEVIRLYSWDEIKTPGFVPTTFTERLEPASATNSVSVGQSEAKGSGTSFHGTIAFGTPPVDAAYSNSMRLVTVTLSWTNGNIGRSRTMKTLIAEKGIHEFIY